jgi:MFS family permease
MAANVTKLHLINVLGHTQFHVVIFTLFVLSKGFSTRDFFLVESAYAVALLVAEVPTGVVSDRLSRKWSLVAASVIGLAAMPFVILSASFPAVMGAMAVAGVAGALASGTDVALLYDSLVALGRDGEFKHILGRMALYRSLAMALSGIVGGLLSRWDMAYAWWASFGVAVLSLPIRVTLREPPFRDAMRDEPYWRHLGQTLRFSFSGSAGYFVLYAAVIWLFFRLGFWLWQPFLDLIALPVAAFGLVYAAQNVVYGFASSQAHRLEGRLGMRWSLLAIPLVLAAVFTIQALSAHPAAAAIVVVHAAASGLFSVLLEVYINERVPSDRRATVLSVKNVVNSLLFAVFSPMVGQLVDSSSLPLALAALATALVAVAVGFALRYRSDLAPRPLASG